MNKRVVVTGMGVVSPVGCGVETFWNSLRTSRSGVGPIRSFDASKLPCRVAAEVTDFDPKALLDVRTAQRTARFTQFALVAAREAWQAAGLPERLADARRGSVFLGNGIGGLEVDSEAQFKLFDKGPTRVGALSIPKMIANEAAGNLSMAFGLRGIAHTVVTACASGTDALGHALELIRADKADVVLTGGTEATIIEFGIAGFCALKALSTQYNDTPEQASRPFDADRDGFVMGEGAGVLVFESLEHALNRGAQPLAEIVGWGATSDAFHLTAPDPEGTGAAEAIRLALADASLAPSDIDYINAHGTGTPTNDPIETLAIKKAFGEEEARRLKISSIKGAIGHCLGAAGGLEAVATIQAIRNDFVPPTLHLERFDAACDLDYVPQIGQPLTVRAALSLSLGFGGHNSVAAFKKYIP